MKDYIEFRKWEIIGDLCDELFTVFKPVYDKSKFMNDLEKNFTVSHLLSSSRALPTSDQVSLQHKINTKSDIKDKFQQYSKKASSLFAELKRIEHDQREHNFILPARFLQSHIQSYSVEGWELISVIPITRTIRYGEGATNELIGYDYYWKKE